ncbi:MAG: RICIN domain-containing protein [Oscillospiraceae bacterium]|nr:RICIN domain-containing protein [Oscillospiraceae bacterium]
MTNRRKTGIQRLLGTLTAAAVSATAFAGMVFPAHAAQNNWKFDLGGNGAASGFTGVSASDGYNASRGYGFSGSVANSNSSGSGANSDAVKFTGGTFNVNLDRGLYQVRVTTGNCSRETIMIEGMPQMINLTGNNAVETIQVPVTDGQLNISAVAGRANTEYSIAAIEITQLNTTGAMKPTIWICGDSTVANYYNTADTAQHGWGQFLGDYINRNVFEVRNQASSGQFAKGFYTSGQFDPIKTYGKPGDYYIISIGINDTNKNYTTREEYIATVNEMVKITKDKGMNVILVKQQGRHGDLNVNPPHSGRWFGGDLDTIGKEQGCTVIDDFTLWQDFGFSIGGYDAMTDYYAAGDDLHQSKKGAQKNAELIAAAMKIGDTEMDTSAYYTFRNVGSGLVMDVKDGKMEEGANVQQWDSNDLACQKWQLTPFANGTTYYYVRSAADPNYVLKAMTGEAGGNIELVPYAGNDSMMLFQFTKIGNGNYYISTRSSRDACFLDVNGASKEAGANIQQWSNSYNNCQVWEAVKVAAPAQEQPTEPEQPATQPDTPEQPTQPQEPDGEIVMGDVNSDGIVDIFDLAILKRHVLGKTALTGDALTAADVTGDSAVDAADIILHQKHLHGLDAPFAAPVISTDGGRYFAVDQVWDQGVVETLNTGYTREDGYINLDNNNTSNITFMVNVPKAGNYAMMVRFANGTADDRPMQVTVGGDKSRIWLQSFPGTGAWTDWKEINLVLPLKKGDNTIEMLSHVDGKGGPNLDFIELTLTDEPIGDLWDPNAQQQIVTGDKPVVYLAGDSTCQSYSASKKNGQPIQGWGYYFQNYFTDDVTVYNHAVAGRSSKKFYDEGRFQAITDSLKKGDFVMIQFAINDADKSKSDRYAPTCGNVDNPTSGSYEAYVTSMIKDTQAKGATPILMSCTLSAKSYANGKFNASYTNYSDACKKLAAKYNCPYFDCNGMLVNHYNSVGYDKAVSYHVAGVAGGTDLTHYNDQGGAEFISGLIAGGIKNANIPGLSQYVK